MKEAPETKNAQLRDLERALAVAFGSGRFPLQLVGDLDDLAFTLEKALAALRALTVGGGGNARDLQRTLQQVEIMLEEDLPVIFADVLPALKQGREGLYEAAEEDESP